jgi:hypothetical protein
VFPGARLNDAQHVLRREAPGQVALLALSETTSPPTCEHPADGHRDAGRHEHRRDLDERVA